MRIDTWADGFGRFYARVPVSNDQKSDKRLARAAIIREINDRGPVKPVTRREIKVEEAPDYYNTEYSGATITYREKD